MHKSITQQRVYAAKFKKYGGYNRFMFYGIYYDEEKERYIRAYRPHRSACLKKISNKRVRRQRGRDYTPTRQHGKYRRVLDFKWNMD